MELDHRTYHYVSSTSLNRCVDGGSEAVTEHILHAFLPIEDWGQMLRQVSIPAEESFRPSLLKRKLLDSLLPVPHFRSIVIPEVNCSLGFLHRRTPILHETVDRLPIGYREVHDFGFLPFIRELLLEQGYWRFSLGVIPFEQYCAFIKFSLNIRVHPL